MTDVLSALESIYRHTGPVSGMETVSTRSSPGRILGETIHAREDFPAFDNSAMDGYVFSKKDLDEGRRDFEIAFEIRPEDENLPVLRPGTCAYITTGSAVPQGGDTVIPVELIRKTGDRVYAEEQPSRNPIRKKGEGYKKGDILLESGKRLLPADIGVLHSNGQTAVRVLAQTRIALQVTGNELDETRNTNGPVLRHLLNGFDSVSVDEFPVLKDDETEMKERFTRLLDDGYDLVVTTGGISAGEYDLVIPVLASLGTRFHVRKVSQKPGKPFSFGTLGATAFVCLPGNPVSAFFCSVLYVNRIIQTRNHQKPVECRAMITNGYTTRKMDEFAPGRTGHNGAVRQVTTVAAIQSHLLHILSNSDCFVRFEPGKTYRKGDEVTIFPY
ncbi:MAG: molybdopterin molybdotransferase MoeA [Balneolales bacterium]